jgi:hypothetical protein
MTVDPSELEWSAERLDGLANIMAAELSARGVKINDETSAMAHAIVAFVVPRAKHLTCLDIVDALGNVFPPARTPL